MKILILGSAGNLGSQLRALLPGAAAWGRTTVDAVDFASLGRKISVLKPEVIINCVAYNNVDAAEADGQRALLLNSTLPAELSRIANEGNATLVHVSTGYVFDGTKQAYSEDDAPNPINAYGRSKLAGERAVRDTCKKFYIVRTNVLFGRPGTGNSKRSFVDTMLELAKTRSSVNVVDDEVNSATYLPDLARHIVHLIESGKQSGTYHVVNSGSASWFELAKETFKLSNLDVTVVPVHGTELPRPALRPHRVVLENTKLPALRPWQDALQEYLRGNYSS